jgi:CheY-like chemotaxis protein
MAMVMVLDDNRLIGKMFTDILEPYGYEVLAIERPSEALELLRNLTPAVIIVDYVLPEMNGIEFVKKVRSLRRKEVANVPIVGLSGADPIDDIKKRFAEAGISLFLYKPVKPEALLNAVDFFCVAP